MSNETKYQCFVFDYGTKYWYKIPVELRDEFESFVQRKSTSDIIWEGTNFDVYRSLNPVNYMFGDVQVLKVS